MRELADAVERWRGRGERVAVATVVGTRRSAPRPIGARLAVSERGDLAGSVSGGCVEAEVAAHAREVLAGAPPRLLTFGIADELAFEIGLPCGGEIDVFVDVPDEQVLTALLTLPPQAGRAVHVTVVSGAEAGAELLVLPDGTRLGNARLAAHAGDASGLVQLDEETVFVDVFAPPPRLLVFGAVDTADALCRAAAALGWRTAVADPRSALATPERLPHAGEIVVAWPEDALARLRPDADTAVVVLTHEERFDVPALAGVLASDAFYVGALGSRRNQERRRERLLAAGVAEDALDRLAGPCGLDVGASTPAETAVSILAEMLAVRAGRSGGRLKEARGRIHADVA